MFGMGMGEIVLIAIVALLALGPDRLPGAAKALGKGIRDLRQQTKGLRDTIEKDTEIGGAMRDLRTALSGDPETLYKAATGEDFNDDWKPGDSQAADTARRDVEGVSDSSDSADNNAEDPLAAYANTDDSWGQAATNPHSHTAADKEEESGEMEEPLIRPAQNMVARGEIADGGAGNSENVDESESGESRNG